MVNVIASDNQSLIVGAGATGLSAARYLEKSGASYKVYDTRSAGELAEPFRSLNDTTQVFLGEFDDSLLEGVGRIILSPGVARTEAVVSEAVSRGIWVESDVSVFLKEVKAPVVGITGTNGKSTVTTMMGLVAEQAGIDVCIGGNLGVPVLDMLDGEADLYVLELSSFQLESTDDAGLNVAVNLNLSQDHFDRHGSLHNYFQAKQKIFHGAKSVVYNLADSLTQPPIVEGVTRFGFANTRPQERNENQFYFDAKSGFLMWDSQRLMPQNRIRLRGSHNIENVLAVYAIAAALGIDPEYVEKVAETFSGLKHRCQIVASSDLQGHEVTFVNDSKATNVGATVSAIRGFVDDFDEIVLIAGGVGKDQDFDPLGHAVFESGISVVLLGRDADKIAAAMPFGTSKTISSSLPEALSEALKLIESSEVIEGVRKVSLVLFSPACASFDMFSNFEERGRVFAEEVIKIVQHGGVQ